MNKQSSLTKDQIKAFKASGLGVREIEQKIGKNYFIISRFLKV